MFYLLAYGLTTVGIFAVLTLVRDGDGEASHLSQWAGLASRSPITAAVMSLFLLALAGIPLTAGFTAKFAVFRAAIEAGAWPLAWSALLASAVAAFFYLRVIVLMYFSQPAADGPTVGVPGLPTTIVLAITATATARAGHPARARCWTWPSRRLSSSVDDRSQCRSRGLADRRARTLAPGSTPASTIGPWLPEGELGAALAEGWPRRGGADRRGRQRAPVRHARRPGT